MNEPTLYENTRIAAYFLWEYTACDNAFDLWLCAEEMALFLEQSNIMAVDQVEQIIQLGIYDLGYVHFVEHIAYRAYLYTHRQDDWHNWFAAERLLSNNEWIKAVTSMAGIYRSKKTNQSLLDDIRSDNVRAYYSGS